MGEIKILNGSNFESETSQGVVLLDFFAEWCGPCRMLSQVLEQILPEVGEKAKIVKVNIEESPELAKEFMVRSIPALFVLKDGKIVKSMQGVQDKNTLLKAIEI